MQKWHYCSNAVPRYKRGTITVTRSTGNGQNDECPGLPRGFAIFVELNDHDINSNRIIHQYPCLRTLELHYNFWLRNDTIVINMKLCL